MDQLQKSGLLKQLTGQIFVSQFDALRALDPVVTESALGMPREYQGTSWQR
jgi:SulP family sulfate permease